MLPNADTGNCDGVAYVDALNSCLTDPTTAPAQTPNYGAFLECVLLPDINSCSNNDDCTW